MKQMSTERLTVSIVIPVYNEATEIGMCLDAIAKQTVLPDEVIVVDNNSSDDTVKIAQNYPFVTVIYESEQGIVFARNCGFNAAKSDIIARIDADTRLKSDWIKKIHGYYAVPAHHNRAVSGGGYFYNLYWPKFVGKLQHDIAFRYNRFIMGGYILWGSNMAIPQSIWREIYPELCVRTDIHEDVDLAIHLQRRKYKVDYRQGLLVGVRMRRVHTDRSKLWTNLLIWPRTFKTHGYSLWPFALIAALALFVVATPLRLVERILLASSRHPRANIN